MKTQRVMRTCFSLVVLTALIIAAGCDSQKSGKVEQGVKKIVFDPKDACNLLKKEEVEAVMKQKVQDLEPQNGYCQYRSQGPKYISFSISVATFDASGGDLKDLKRTMEKDAQKLGQVIKQADGFGDDAFFQLVPKDNTKFLHLIKGKYYFTFETRGDKGNELPEDAVKTLVRKALDRV